MVGYTYVSYFFYSSRYINFITKILNYSILHNFYRNYLTLSPWLKCQFLDFNKFYLQENTPLVNASSPTEGYENGGIMAANEVLGGSGGFSSW